MKLKPLASLLALLLVVAPLWLFLSQKIQVLLSEQRWMKTTLRFPVLH